jgi:putative membrane protein
MSRPEKKLRPQAFRLKGNETVPLKNAGAEGSDSEAPFIIHAEEDAYEQEQAKTSFEADNHATSDQKSHAEKFLDKFIFSWSGVFISSVSGLISLAFSLWAWNFVEDLFVKSSLLGFVGLILVAMASCATIVFCGREIISLLRQNQISKLHDALAAAHAADNIKEARQYVVELCNIYRTRNDTAQARTLVANYSKQIMNGRDLIDLTERNLIAPLDDQARREIATAAKRVSVVTALSPRAILDIFFVAAQAIMLIRRIAEIYGGRPGLLGFFKLTRSIGAHLAITGFVSAGDTLMQQVVGHGIASRVSAKLGEGVLNGLLTARVGLSAMAVCRPTAFITQKAPSVSDVAPFLFNSKTRD